MRSTLVLFAGSLAVLLIAGVASAEERANQGWTPRVNAFMDAGGELRMADMDDETLGDDSGFFMRAFGVFLGAQLSPSTSFFTGTCYQDGFKIGVAYITLHGLLPGLNLRIGKFRQALGVVQPWLLPRLDQFDRPLSLRLFLGPEGLEQIGVSLEWALPLGFKNNPRILLQATNGSNPRLFSGEFYSVPVGLLRFEQAVSASPRLRMQFGLSGMYGGNNRRNLTNDSGERVDEPWRETTVAGADFGLIWFVEESDYFTWRTEGFWVGKQTGSGYLAAAGGYSYLDFSHADRWIFGLRGDLAQPFKVDNHDELLWQAVAYIGFAPWSRVRLRLQASHQEGGGLPADDRFILQVSLCTNFPALARKRKNP